MLTKRKIVRLVLCTELLFLAAFYLMSPHGIRALTGLRLECVDAEKQLMRIKYDVARLESELTRWLSDPFYKEKIAREQLQMVRKGDVVYYVKS